MANSKIKVINILDTRPDSFSVEYEFEGQTKGHTFPRHPSMIQEDEDGVPGFIYELIRKHEEEKANQIDTSKINKKEYIPNEDKVLKIREKITKQNQIRGVE